MFTDVEENRIRATLSGHLSGTAIEATTKNGEVVEVWFSFDGSLNVDSIRQVTFD